MGKEIVDGNQTENRSYLYKQAKGKVAIRMSNDYLFRALMQMNVEVRQSLVGALLHIRPEQIRSTEIENPIELGTHIDDKYFFLDVKILLNNKSLVNLEMQVLNENNWNERSLLYLCRAFDNLNRGDDYTAVLPAVHVGLLDFSLFEDRSEFYASYMFMNVKTHCPYSEKLRLNVLELHQSEHATEEDRLWHLDKWAKFFKADTWEEVKELARELPVLDEAAETIYQISQDRLIRQQCEALEEYYRIQNTRRKLIEMQDQKIEDQSREIDEQSREIEEQSREIEEQSREIEEQNHKLKEQNHKLEEQSRELEKQAQKLEEKDKELKEKDREMEQLKERVRKLEEIISSIS